MNWNTQRGGPWGGGGGGGGGPWGGGGGGGPRAPQPPDIEEMLRRGQDRFKKFMPGGVGGVRRLVMLVLAALVVWLLTGIYTVDTDEEGVVLLFGEWVDRKPSGLHWWFPAPIGQVITPKVTRQNRTDIGFRGTGESGIGGSTRDVPEESLMITSDQNITDADFTVFWRIKDSGQYLFNIRDPEGTVKAVAESAMREAVGQTSLQDTLTGQRQQIANRASDLMQTVLDSYKSGISVERVQFLRVDPPNQVIDAFNEVQRARQDKERLQNEALAYKNRIVPTARGEASKMIEEANAYKERLIKEAEGEAQRFLSVYEAYKENRQVTRQGLFLERMQEIMQDTEKVILDSPSGGTGVVPFLPLPEIQRRTRAAADDDDQPGSN